MILTPQGDTLTFDDFINELKSFDVVFVGEHHDAAGAHAAELKILEGLAEDSTLVMGLEMFERDVQEQLDGYLDGEIAEEDFLAQSRPWGNYETDYRPLVEFSKENDVPVIAANVPRRAASAVAGKGEVTAEVLGADSVYLPDTLHLDSEEYYQRFAATMQAMPHSTPMGGMNIDAFYTAQVLKDAVMAQALHPYLDRRIIFFCGRFHSDYHLGVPYQLSRNHPGLKIGVVSLMGSEEEISAPDRAQIADFILRYQ